MSRVKKINTFKDLEPADHSALASALTTIYKEGTGHPPRNPTWDDELGKTVHDIATYRKKRDEEEAEEARKYYEANKEEIDAERELKRKEMEAKERERKKKAAERELKRKLSSRKHELKHADRVMKWKTSAAAEEPASAAPHETQTMAEMAVLESAKRGPKHDLCEECGKTLKFCTRKGCPVVGCIKCFEETLVKCGTCSTFVCEDHMRHFKGCWGCPNLVCKRCGGTSCQNCDYFCCNDCEERPCPPCDEELNPVI
ncbi:unnamed protein product [Calypogeia fissa]